MPRPQPAESGDRDEGKRFERMMTRSLWSADGELGGAGLDPSVSQNLCAQATVSFEKRFRSGSETLVKPIARLAMRGAAQMQALQLEFYADQCVEIHARDDHVAPQNAGRFLHLGKRRAQIFEDFL